MDANRWRTIRELLGDALELPAGERAALVAARAAGDRGLEREVMDLLAEEARADSDSFLEPPAPGKLGLAGAADAEDARSRVGTRVGPYEIERPIAAGGMGAVFLARRADGEFDQRVAVKLIKLGMDTGAILARFRNERQVLATLGHPGIARLVDGGATDDGRPYLVMEYVEGVPVDRWCSERELSLRARLELFLKICAAVQHAHQRLVVHRDLKPANILVTEDGEPKLLDFGLAKVLRTEAGARTLEVTAEGERMMTPLYAAPEQIRGAAVTTATDVYALGVLLYELLAERRPYELAGLPWTKIEQVICAQDPPRPSQAPGGATGSGSARRLSGDLDTIVMTALRKEPERRYGSVEQLAGDLTRYMAGHPITARPDTLGYRTAKFVRRNRALVTAASLVAVSTVAAGVGIARQAGIARAEARTTKAALRVTQEALDNAQGVSRFMGDVLLAASPRRGGVSATVLEAVDAAAERVESEAGMRPWVEGSVRTVLGSSYRELGQLAQADAQLRAAVELRRGELGDEHALTLYSLHELALVQRDAGELDLARETLAGVLEARRGLRDVDPGDVGRTLLAMAAVEREAGELERAQELLSEVLTGGHAADLGPEVLVARKEAAVLARLRGDLGRAEEELRSVLAAQEEALGSRHPDTLITLSDLASCLVDRGRAREAVPMYEGVLAGFDERGTTADNLDRLIVETNLASCLVGLSEWARAAAIGPDLVERTQARLGDNHDLTVQARRDLAFALFQLGRLAEARPYLERTLESLRRTEGGESEEALLAQRVLAVCLAREGRADEAAVLLEDALEHLARSHGEHDELTVDFACRLAQTLFAMERVEEAERLFARYARRAPAATTHRGGFLIDHARCLLALERDTEAEQALLAAFEALEHVEGPAGPLALQAARMLAELYESLGRGEEAERWQELGG